MKNKNIHIYPSPFKNETRILKEAYSVLKFGVVDYVEIAALHQKGLIATEHITETITVKRFKSIFFLLPKKLPFEIIKFIVFNLKVFFYYAFDRSIKYVNCHSLSVLLLGVLIKKTNSSVKLIYDAHELETERASLKGVKQKLAKKLERSLIKKADSVIVVSPSIADWYKKEYNLTNVFIVKNIPLVNNNIELESTKAFNFKNHFNIANSNLLFIYQGLLSKGRGIELLLEAFKQQTNKHIVFMGYGPLEDLIVEQSKQNATIHFFPAVSPDKIIEYTKGADIGISLIENIGLSYYYCLPNKLFEYILAGKPVLASNFPDMANVIQEGNCGWLTTPNLQEVINILNTITNESKEEKTPHNTINKKFNWLNEEIELIKAFK